jgi:Na+-driven multidrug efflux pump
MPFLWLLPGVLGISISKIIAANLGGIGKPHYATYTSMITIALTILLDILMIPVYSIVGAAIASSIAYLFSTGLLIYWFSKETKIKISEVIIPRKSDMTILIARTGLLWNRLKEKSQ